MAISHDDTNDNSSCHGNIDDKTSTMITRVRLTVSVHYNTYCIVSK